VAGATALQVTFELMQQQSFGVIDIRGLTANLMVMRSNDLISGAYNFPGALKVLLSL
jgi:hypothetical protein